MIPVDWRCEKVGDLTDLLTGFPFPSSGYSQSGIPLLRGSNVKRGHTDWSGPLVAYWPSVTSEIRKYLLKLDDIVVAMDGSLVGRSFASLGKGDVPALLLQRVARLRSDSVLQAYLTAWVCSQRFTNHCDLVKTTTAIPHISPADIRSFEIAVPPTKAEQEAIAEALSDADALIESLEQLLTKKRHLKQAAMQELLTGKKRLPGFSGAWEMKRLLSLVTIAQGQVDPKVFPYCSMALVGPEHVESGTGKLLARRTALEQGAISGKYLFKAGDVVYGKINPYLRKAFLADFDGLCSADMYPFRPVEGVASGFLLAVILGSEFSKYSESVSARSGMPKINRDELAGFSIRIPLAFDEQTAIAAVLLDMKAEIDDLEAQLAKTRAIKQGMMHNLLSGTIRLI